MGKHNGKARSTGLQVGAALTNRSRKGVPNASNGYASGRHTSQDSSVLQSVLETSDLGEMLSMAELAGRDFAAQRDADVIVISTGAVEAKPEQSEEARQEAERRNRHRLAIPRRPAWSSEMSAAAVEAQERAAFVEWRRDLAALEEQEHALLTPFEKNLEVWRQLWRVLERSHIVVQVVDARDPLFYRCQDLEDYALELNPSKASVLLLNKADLLPLSARTAWADYFDSQDVDYLFWSAKAASEAEQAERSSQGDSAEDLRTRVLGVEQLLPVLEAKAEAAAEHARAPFGGADYEGAEPSTRVVVGLTGYPNVGKSSTINALFGSKKTAVAPTPGKTKRFQTLHVTDRLTLCDCPGLVMPRYAPSKGDLVAAGVIPIDRLTDVRAPAAVIAHRIPRAQLEAAYAMHLPRPAPHESPNRAPTAAELLRAVASSRGWSVGGGLPDEARAGRLLLRDYTAGRLLHLHWPPGYKRAHVRGVGQAEEAAQPAESAAHMEAEPHGQATAEVILTEAELDGMLLRDCGEKLQLSGNGVRDRPRRPDYKFQKKPARTKVRSSGQGCDPGGGDGAALPTGRKGGLIRLGA